MNQKITSGIVLGLVLTAAGAFAATEKMETSTPVATVSADEIADAPEMSLEERVAALEANGQQSAWADHIKFSGDLRYRFEYRSRDGGDTDQNRQRIRARLGATADVNDFTSAGIRIRTGQDANSGNQTIGGNWDSKDIYFDLAYITLQLGDGEWGAVTLGKMKYPWMVASDLIWDSDVNPEGIAHTYSRELDSFDVFSSLGGFKVEETSSAHDLNLLSAQVGGITHLNDDVKLTAGGSIFSYDNAEDFLGFDCKILEAFAEVSFKDVMPVPVKLYGNYVNNILENDDNQGICAGIKFGDKKKGKWEAKVDLRRLEELAAPSDFADSDFAGGGTGVKGIRGKAAYNIAKHLECGVTVIGGKEIDTGEDVKTLHLDLIAKF